MSAPKCLFIFYNSFFCTVDRKYSQTKTFSQNMIYMFCLYHFSVKCIIKKKLFTAVWSPEVRGLAYSFFYLTLKLLCQGKVMGFVGGGGNIAIATALPSLFVYCIVNIK